MKQAYKNNENWMECACRSHGLVKNLAVVTQTPNADERRSSTRDGSIAKRRDRAAVTNMTCLSNTVNIYCVIVQYDVRAFIWVFDFP